MKYTSRCSQPGHLRSLRSCLAASTRNGSECNGASVKSNTMPSISLASMSTSATNEKWSRENCQTKSSRLASGGGEGVVHTVAVHYAHAPSEDVTTK